MGLTVMRDQFFFFQAIKSGVDLAKIETPEFPDLVVKAGLEFISVEILLGQNPEKRIFDGQVILLFNI